MILAHSANPHTKLRPYLLRLLIGVHVIAAMAVAQSTDIQTISRQQGSTSTANGSIFKPIQAGSHANTCTVNPTKLQWTVQHLGPMDWPIAVSISAGCGSWTTNVAGWYHHAQIADSQPTAGSGAATLYLRPWLWTDDVGTYHSTTASIAGQLLDITVTVVPAEPVSLMVNSRGTPDSSLPLCSTPASALIPMRTGCRDTLSHPWGNHGPWQTQQLGRHYTDSVFGTDIWRAGDGYASYSPITPINLSEDLLITNLGIYALDGSGLIAPDPWVSSGGFYFGSGLWSAVDPYVLYRYDNSQGFGTYHKVVVDKVKKTATDMGVILTTGKAGQGIAPSANRIVRGDWISYYTYDFHWLCAQSFISAGEKCYDMTTLKPVPQQFRHTMIVEDPNDTTKYYVEFQSNTAGEMLFSFHVKDRTLTLEQQCLQSPGMAGPLPQACDPNNFQAVLQTPHNSVAVLNGHPSMVYQGGIAYPFRFVYLSFAFDSGAQMATIPDLGGGLGVIHNPNVDHVGCALLADVCTTSAPSGSVTSRTVASIAGTVGGPATISFVEGQPFTIGTKLICGAVGGVTSLNGAISTVTAAAANSVTVDTVVNGPYSSGGVCGDVTTQPSNYSEIDVMKDGGTVIKRLAIAPVSFDTAGPCYFCQPHSTISPFGTYACWTDDGGVPNDFHTYCALTGLGGAKHSNEFSSTANVTVQPAKTQATLSITAPSTDNITCVVSPARDLSAAPISQVAAGPAIYRTLSFVGLSSYTQYYSECVIANKTAVKAPFVTTKK